MWLCILHIDLSIKKTWNFIRSRRGVSRGIMTTRWYDQLNLPIARNQAIQALHKRHATHLFRRHNSFLFRAFPRIDESDKIHDTNRNTIYCRFRCDILTIYWFSTIYPILSIDVSQAEYLWLGVWRRFDQKPGILSEFLRFLIGAELTSKNETS